MSDKQWDVVSHNQTKATPPKNNLASSSGGGEGIWDTILGAANKYIAKPVGDTVEGIGNAASDIPEAIKDAINQKDQGSLHENLLSLGDKGWRAAKDSLGVLGTPFEVATAPLNPLISKVVNPVENTLNAGLGADVKTQPEEDKGDESSLGYLGKILSTSGGVSSGNQFSNELHAMAAPLLAMPFGGEKAEVIKRGLEEPIGASPAAHRIAQLHNENGGSTYGLHTDDLSGKNAYAVSLFPERGEKVNGDVTPNHIQNFIENNRDVLRDPRATIGTWRDADGVSHLDISGTTPNRQSAIDAATKHNQQSVYHLKTGELIPTRSSRTINPLIADGADAYNAEMGLPKILHSSYLETDPRATRIANNYDAMEHNPYDPPTASSYNALKNEVAQQFDFAQNKMGITFEPWDKEGQPYKNSKEMSEDVDKNKHLYFFTGGDIPQDHPLAQVAPNGLTYNDMFRAVHDLFGHAKDGFQFGPRGEENAWNSHMQMFSPEARPAMTTETKGQNSWVNYGPHGEANRANPQATVYAPQKAGILPEEFHTRPDNLDSRLDDLDSGPTKTPFSGVHYSKAPIKNGVISGEMRGASGVGAEKTRLNLGRGAAPGIYAYREGARPEPVVASGRGNVSRIKGDYALAEIENTPLWHDTIKVHTAEYKKQGFNDTQAFQMALNDAEHTIRDHGYDGYYSQYHPDSVFLFGDHPVTDNTGKSFNTPSILDNQAKPSEWQATQHEPINQIIDKIDAEQQAKPNFGPGAANKEEFDGQSIEDFLDKGYLDYNDIHNLLPDNTIGSDLDNHLNELLKDTPFSSTEEDLINNDNKQLGWKQNQMGDYSAMLPNGEKYHANNQGLGEWKGYKLDANDNVTESSPFYNSAKEAMDWAQTHHEDSNASSWTYVGKGTASSAPSKQDYSDIQNYIEPRNKYKVDDFLAGRMPPVKFLNQLRSLYTTPHRTIFNGSSSTYIPLGIREAIQEMRNKDDDFNKLYKAVESWSGGGYEEIYNNAKEIVKKGKTEGDYYDKAGQKASLLLNAVREAEPDNSRLYRGVKTERPIEAFEKLKEGDLFEIPGPSAFSRDENTAKSFGNLNYISKDSASAQHSRYLLVLEGDSKRFNLAPLSHHSEHEEITQGRFKVNRIEDVPQGATTKQSFGLTTPAHKVIYITHEGVF
jgi:hypothetical protein